MSKFSRKGCPQMKYEWVYKEREDTVCYIMSQKDHKFERKFTFDIPKLKFENGLEQKTTNFWAF